MSNEKATSHLLSSDEIKKIELNILIEFDRYCKEKGLYYTLCGGTLLGAIRHKGFIPWDDDIDVLMPRDHYERLLNIAEQGDKDLPDHIKVVSWKDGSSDFPFIKLLDKRTVIDNKYVEDKKTNSLWIDVFPIDGNPSDDEELRKLFKKSLFLRKMLTTKQAKVGGGKTLLKRVTKPIVKVFLLPFSIKSLCNKIDMHAKSYSIEDSKYLGGVVWGYGVRERIDKEKYLKSVPVEFEGLMFPAPSNYEEYLSGLYGDYMQLPPEDKRQTHEIIAYIKD